MQKEVWDRKTKNRTCKAVSHGRQQARTIFLSIYTNAFTSNVSRGLDKHSPKLGFEDCANTMFGIIRHYEHNFHVFPEKSTASLIGPLHDSIK